MRDCGSECFGGRVSGVSTVATRVLLCILLNKGLLLRVSSIDSAQWYYNEESCGKAIKDFLSTHPELTREDIFFTTKLQGNTSYDGTRRAIRSSIEKTGLRYLDLYLLHSPYGGAQKRGECWRAVADAVEAGEVRAGGVSNFGLSHLREFFHRDREPGRRPVVNQIEVHPFNTNEEIVSTAAPASMIRRLTLIGRPPSAATMVSRSKHTPRL